jgi:Domain of unknown function (DUF1835)
VSRAIHVTYGDSALAEGHGIPWDNVVPLRDSLDSGPLREMRDLASWRSARLAFWEGMDRGLGQPRRRRRESQEWMRYGALGEPDRLNHAEEVVLWLGTGLSDQLTLTWMPQLLRLLAVSLEKLRVVQFVRTANGKATLGVGVLRADEFRAAPAKRAIDGAELAYLDEVWKSVTAPDPGALLRLLGDDVRSTLPWLTAAMPRLLWRYPGIRTGVNRFEERLLANTRDHGPRAVQVIVQSMRDSWHEEDWVGDNWLWWRLKRLADPALPHPAVAVTGDGTTMARTEVHLTSTGGRIVNAESNFLALNGIDDWVGGVHLDSRAGNVWFYGDGTLVCG